MSNTIAGLYKLISYLPTAPSPEKPKETKQAASSETKVSAPVTVTEARTKQPPTSAVVARVELENGETISITEDSINLPKDLPRMMHLKIKYDMMAKLMTASQEKGKAKNFIILDPTLDLIYLINTILTKDFKPEAFHILGKRILSLSSQNPDKPYLIIMYVQTMLNQQKISIPEAENLISKAEREFPYDAEIKHELSKFYFSTNKIYTAGSYLEEAVKANPSYLLELGNYYALISEVDKADKAYASALNLLESAKKAFKKAAKLKQSLPRPLPLLLANLSQKKAEIYILQEEYRTAYKALEFTVDIYQREVEANPAIPELYLALAKTYLTLLNVNRSLPGLHPYLEYHTLECEERLKEVLEKAEKISQGNPQLLPEIANTFIAIGKTDKALKIFQELKRKDPKNPLPLLQMGDLLLSKGEIEASFGQYEEALKISKNLEILSEVYLRFCSLVIQTELGLAQLKTNKPNALQGFLNSLAMSVMLILVPTQGVANMLGRGINKAFNKNYSQEDLQEIIQRSRSLITESFNKICSLAEKEKNPMVFYQMAEMFLARAKNILPQIKHLEEKELVTEEEIKAYKDIIKTIRNQATGLLEFVLNESYVKGLGAEFQKAKNNRDIQKMFEIAQNYFGIYFFLLDKSENEILNESHKEIIAEKKGAAFEKGIETLEEILEFAEEVKDIKFSFGVYDLANKLYKKSLVLGEKEQESIEEITKVIIDSLKTTMDIAKKNKDIHTLLELGKGIDQLGPFSLKALEEAIDIAKDNETELLEIGKLIYKLWRRTESQGSIEKIAVKETLRKLALSAYNKIPEKAESEKKILAWRQTIDEIKIVGNSRTKTDVIRRELRYAGLKAGNDLPTNPSKIYRPLFEAANRIESFTVKDVKLVNKDGKNVLIVKVEEQDIGSFLIGGGGGNAQAMANANIANNNLFGGGEKIGVDFSYVWFYPKGYNHYHTWNGKLYYFDPHLLALGKDTPVSGGINLEKASRFNYESNALEKMFGGGVTLGVKIAEGTTLSVSPQFYYIQNDTSYSQPSIRIALQKDGRDNWLFPKSGYYLSTSVEPGMYLNHSTQFFIKNTNEGRYYVELPWEMTLALRAVVGVSHNLKGGNKYFLGGDMLNPYVRVSNGSTSVGSAILAGSLELRAPLIDLGFTKIQFYGFGDVGTLLSGRSIRVLGSVGAGARILLPIIGPINIGGGYPGGFFIWFGNLGWN